MPEPVSVDHPAKPGGTEPDLPLKAELTERDELKRGYVTIEVRRFWPERGEKVIVERALAHFPPAALEGLRGVSFIGTKESPRGLGGIRGAASAQYRTKRQWIFLSRVGGDTFNTVADAVHQREALKTIVHELAHHVYSRTLTREERRAWRSLLWDRALLSRRAQAEVFAGQMQAYLTDRTRFDAEAGFYPGLRELFSQVFARWHSQQP